MYFGDVVIHVVIQCDVASPGVLRVIFEQNGVKMYFDDTMIHVVIQCDVVGSVSGGVIRQNGVKICFGDTMM